MAGFIAASNIATINHSQLNGLLFYAASYLQWQCNISAFELTVEDSKMMDLFLIWRETMASPIPKMYGGENVTARACSGVFSALELIQPPFIPSVQQVLSMLRLTQGIG